MSNIDDDQERLPSPSIPSRVVPPSFEQTTCPSITRSATRRRGKVARPQIRGGVEFRRALVKGIQNVHFLISNTSIKVQIIVNNSIAGNKRLSDEALQVMDDLVKGKRAL